MPAGPFSQPTDPIRPLPSPEQGGLGACLWGHGVGTRVPHVMTGVCHHPLLVLFTIRDDFQLPSRICIVHCLRDMG